MKLNKNRLAWMGGTVLSLLLTANANAFCWENYWNNCCDIYWESSAEVTGGYRQDRINTWINSFDPPGTLIQTDNLRIKRIRIWETQVQGRTTICRDWFFKSFAAYGQVEGGKYIDIVKLPSPSTLSATSRADVNEGSTWDYSIGTGYYISIYDGIRAAPTGGYSTHYQRVKLEHAKTDGVADSTLNGLNYTTRWQGPWVGVELAFPLYCLDFTGGYEYHIAHWHASWKLKGADVFGGDFSDRRRARDAWGDVIYLDARYNVCGCQYFDSWNVGLGLKYQYWKAKGGNESPLAGSFVAVGGTATEVDKIPTATWKSFEIQLTTGVQF